MPKKNIPKQVWFCADCRYWWGEGQIQYTKCIKCDSIKILLIPLEELKRESLKSEEKPATKEKQ